MRASFALLLLLLLACDGATSPIPQLAPAGEGIALVEPTLFPTPTYPPLPPTATASPRFSFIVCGDSWKDQPIFRRIIRDFVAGNDAFMIVVGDITPQGYASQFDDFQRLTSGLGKPVYPVPGNHDVLNGGRASFAVRWPLNQSFDYGAAHFTLYDDADNQLAAAQLAWLRDDLAASSQPLKFVFMHIPSETPFALPLNAERVLQAGAAEFQQIVSAAQVATVFSGHLQAYASYERAGVPRIITGGAGSPLHLPAWMGGYYHYVRVTVDGTQMSSAVVQLPDDGS